MDSEDDGMNPWDRDELDVMMEDPWEEEQLGPPEEEHFGPPEGRESSAFDEASLSEAFCPISNNITEPTASDVCNTKKVRRRAVFGFHG